jgi:hypothetical protein
MADRLGRWEDLNTRDSMLKAVAAALHMEWALAPDNPVATPEPQPSLLEGPATPLAGWGVFDGPFIGGTGGSGASGSDGSCSFGGPGGGGASWSDGRPHTLVKKIGEIGGRAVQLFVCTACGKGPWNVAMDISSAELATLLPKNCMGTPLPPEWAAVTNESVLVGMEEIGRKMAEQLAKELGETGQRPGIVSEKPAPALSPTPTGETLELLTARWRADRKREGLESDLWPPITIRSEPPRAPAGTLSFTWEEVQPDTDPDEPTIIETKA